MKKRRDRLFDLDGLHPEQITFAEIDPDPIKNQPQITLHMQRRRKLFNTLK